MFRFLGSREMGKAELSGRANWQEYSGQQAGIAEFSFHQVFVKEFEGTQFRIRSKPQEFQNVYVDIELSEEVLGEIYNPETPIGRHGITPDYAIDNVENGKTLYVEVKRQDGWVEGKHRSAGRGNAHERSNKFFTPGLLKILRNEGKLGENVLPFWTVFQGDISRDPCRVREITCWYGEYTAHFFMWRNSSEPDFLLRHFEIHLKKLLL